jgi:septal ring factor EnvC (AmiA/AmiB activator)
MMPSLSSSSSSSISNIDEKNSQYLLSTFSNILTSLDKERLQLKGLSALQTLLSPSSSTTSSSTTSDNLIDRLNEIQSTIIRLERMTEDIENSLTEEENELKKCSSMIILADEQRKEIKNIINNIPNYLVDTKVFNDKDGNVIYC